MTKLKDQIAVVTGGGGGLGEGICLCLASSDADEITGQALNVDGGAIFS